MNLLKFRKKKPPRSAAHSIPQLSVEWNFLLEAKFAIGFAFCKRRKPVWAMPMDDRTANRCEGVASAWGLSVRCHAKKNRPCGRYWFRSRLRKKWFEALLNSCLSHLLLFALDLIAHHAKAEQHHAVFFGFRNGCDIISSPVTQVACASFGKIETGGSRRTKVKHQCASTILTAEMNGQIMERSLNQKCWKFCHWRSRGQGWSRFPWKALILAEMQKLLDCLH